ncbi:hypothetical protein HYH02_001020 [Chlamydomonas schloesseri]|uniref:VWFA domain-containing protein n=1 Tax=Chlamydomonas schloesseri TaxID=2026947 RepID=A0A835WTK9_9CHLO|nr:hypothetical protein HYH02_001020 [Chlamydomonas schloesseri]|eukprot:KAG2453974.1 hypothetical protein HYH02_001020 [Chlamydomonas schloesseri]
MRDRTANDPADAGHFAAGTQPFTQAQPAQAHVPTPAEIIARLEEVQAQQARDEQKAQANPSVPVTSVESRDQFIARLVELQRRQALQAQDAARRQYQQYSGQQAPPPEQSAQLTMERIQLQNEWTQHLQQLQARRDAMQSYTGPQMQTQNEQAQLQAQQQRVQAWLQQQAAGDAAAGSDQHQRYGWVAGLKRELVAAAAAEAAAQQLVQLDLQDQQRQHDINPGSHQVPERVPPSVPPGFPGFPQQSASAAARATALLQAPALQVPPPAGQQALQRQQAPGPVGSFRIDPAAGQALLALIQKRGPIAYPRRAVARSILQQAAALPLHRRHELLSAAAADPELAPAFADAASAAGGGHLLPPPPDMHAVARKLSVLLQQTQQGSPPPPTEAAVTRIVHETGHSRDGSQPQQDHAPPLVLTLVLEYQQYALHEEAMRAVISLKAAPEAKQRAHVALTCVLDRSGSMSGDPIELVRQTCHFLVDQLSADDYLGIVSYADDVREDVPLLRMTPAARSLAHAMIDALDEGGGTALYAGLHAGMKQQMEAEKALRQVAAHAAAGGGGGVGSAGAPSRLVHSCFLFTDGQPTPGSGPIEISSILACLEAMQRCANQHVTVHTFGFGIGHSVDMLRGVADAQSGVYYYVSCAEDIPTGFGDALGGLFAVVAKDVRVSVRTAAGVNITAFRSGGRVVDAAVGTVGATVPPWVAEGQALSNAPYDGRTSAQAPPQQPQAAQYTSAIFNDMFAEESRECLLALSLPRVPYAAAAAAGLQLPQQQDVLMCHVDLEYTDVAAGCRRQATAALALPRTASPRPADALPAELVFITAARYKTLDAIEAAQAAAAGGGGGGPGGAAGISAAHELLDAHTARLHSSMPRWGGGISGVGGGPAAVVSQALAALLAQTRTARASIHPRFEFNGDGVAAAASIAQATQALRFQRVGTSTMQSSAPFAALDHKSKSHYRNMSSTAVTACCPSVFRPPPF